MLRQKNRPANRRKNTTVSKKLLRKLVCQSLESRQLMAADLGWTISGGDEQSQAFDVGAISADGALIATLDYRGTIDVAPDETFGNDFDILDAPGDERRDAIVKYNAAGSLQWTKPFSVLQNNGSRGGVVVLSAEIQAGGFYVRGRVDGIVDFEPENPTSSSVLDAMPYTAGGGFVARFDADTGALDWVHLVGAVSTSSSTSFPIDGSLAVDRAGTAYFSFESASFNTSLSTNSLELLFAGQSLGNPEGFYQQSFIATIAPDGTVLQVQRMGSFESLDDMNLAVDDHSPNEADWRVVATAAAGGKVYLGDASSLAAESTAGKPNTLLSEERGYYDADLLMLSMTTAGTIDWLNIYEGQGRQSRRGLEIDSEGTIFYRGRTSLWGDSSAQQPILQFDPSDPSTAIQPGREFIATFRPDGNLIASATLDIDFATPTIGGILASVDARTAQAIDGQLMDSTAASTNYVIKLDKHLSSKAMFRHDSTLKGAYVNDAGVATLWGSLSAGETLPGGGQPVVAGSSDAFAIQVVTGAPLTLPGGQFSIAFEDSFESGSNSNDWNGNWSEDAQNDWQRSSQRAWNGSRSAEVDGWARDAALISRDIDLSNYASAKLDFSWYMESSFDTGEYIAADIWDGNSWQEVKVRNAEVAEDKWLHVPITLGPELMIEDFKVRFRGYVSSSQEDAYVDAVRITGAERLDTTANQPPMANAGSGYTTTEGTPTTLTAASSFDSDGTIVSYNWDFDLDGVYDDASGVTPIFSTTQSGVSTVGLQVIDEDGAAATTTTQILVTNVVPTANAGGNYTVETGNALTLSAAASFDPGQDIATYEWDFDGDGIYETSGVSVSFDTSTAGSFVVGLQVTDQDGASSSTTTLVEVTDPVQEPGPNLTHGVIENVQGIWQTVNFSSSYNSAVLVATPRYNLGSGPGVVRITNVTQTTFDVRVDSVGSSSFSGGIHFVAVEEGVYDVPGQYKLEAVKVDATETGGTLRGWQVGSQTYQQSYANPVVVGQVMSAANEEWSVFWSSGSSRTSPATSGSLNVGKHVGEDTAPDRLPETLGYFVIEANSNGSIDGLAFSAGTGTDSIRGVENGTYQYHDAAPAGASTAVLSVAGMDGSDGGWAALIGSQPVSQDGRITLAVDEDQLRDSERKHTTEQVSYFVIGAPIGEGEGRSLTSPSLPKITAPNALDVDGDGHTSPIDALQLINYLNSERASYDLIEEGDMALDTNGDGYISPIDTLLIINRLNAEASDHANAIISSSRNNLFDIYFGDLEEDDERFWIA